MTEHKLAWALRAVADAMNKGRKAVFYCNEIGDGLIVDVLSNPTYDWQLVKEPVVMHEYYVLNEDTKNYINIKMKANLKHLDMHITLIDGVPQKEVEFR